MERQTDSKQTRAEKALAVALEIRKFEIEMYWKRAAYFWAFLALILGSYVAVLTTAAKELQDHPLLKADGLLTISCLGIVFSVAWYFVNRGSKFWQENWEKHVDLLENSVQGPLYKTVLSDEDPCFRDPMQPYPFSVSKINQILSLVTTCVFLLLALMTALMIVLCGNQWWPTPSVSKYLAYLAMILIWLVTVFVVYVLRCKGETARGKRSHERLDITAYKNDFDLIKTATFGPTSMGTETKPQTETESKTLWVWNRKLPRVPF